MTLDQLRYFYEASKYQHVGKAAKAIHISPSAISAAIGAIEEELELLLFERLGKSILLTSDGKLLQEEAEKILDSFQGLKIRLKGKDSDLKGRFRIGASHFLASNTLTKTWSFLQQEHLNIVGEVCSLPTVNVIEDVVAGKLDFGLCFSPFKHPDLILNEIHSGQMKVVVRKNHPLLKLNSSKILKEISKYPAVIHKAHPGVDICEHHPVFDEFNISVKASFLFDNDDCAVQKIIQSDAWSLLPDVVIDKYRKDISDFPLPIKWHAPYSISTIVRRDRSKNEVLLKLQSLLQKEFSRI